MVHQLPLPFLVDCVSGGREGLVSGREAPPGQGVTPLTSLACGGARRSLPTCSHWRLCLQQPRSRATDRRPQRVCARSPVAPVPQSEASTLAQLEGQEVATGHCLASLSLEELCRVSPSWQPAGPSGHASGFRAPPQLPAGASEWQLSRTWPLLPGRVCHGAEQHPVAVTQRPRIPASLAESRRSAPLGCVSAQSSPSRAQNIGGPLNPLECEISA